MKKTLEEQEQIAKEQESITLESALEQLGYGPKDINSFSKDTGIDYQTLKGWERNEKVSGSGKVTLYYILKCRELEEKSNVDSEIDKNSTEKINKLKEILKEILFDNEDNLSK